MRPKRCEAGERRGSRAARLLGLVLLPLWLAACSEGYPAEDAPLLSPFDMGNPQRLSALNEIGARAHPDRRWSFALDAPCQLQMTHKRKGSRKLEQVFMLQRSMDVELVFDKADRTFDVHLRADSAADAPRLGTVLESPAWTQATQVELLLQLLIRDCGT